MTNQQKFYHQNKDIFLKYIDDKDNIMASIIYDNLVENNLPKLQALIASKSEFRSKNFIKKLHP